MMPQRCTMVSSQKIYGKCLICQDELQCEINNGVVFWGYEENGKLIGVMGIQDVQDVTLIRHAYVRRARQNQGKLYFDRYFLKFHCLWAPLSVNEDVGTTFS